MKKTLAIIALAVAMLNTIHAQTFGGGVTITGTTNALLYSGETILTNYVVFPIPAKSILLSGVSSTNEVAIFSYGFTVAGNTTPVIMGSITNSFAAGTNGGSWSTNIPAKSYTVPVIPWAQVVIGAHTNTIYVP